MKWKIVSKKIPNTSKELVDILLRNRDIKDSAEFFHPTSPLNFKLEDVGIDTAAVACATKRLNQARDKNERIIIYGDYDADGVCATAILWETLYLAGCNVLPFIPDREKHGYGLSARGIDEILAQEKPAILISVDNGIVAHAQWERLKQLGVYTILTDHHEPDEKLPTVDCLIHTKKLTGTTVAWMFAKTVAESMLPTMYKTLGETLDLCAIATIADQVPLTEFNRAFALYGISQLNCTTRLGLQLLIESAKLKPGEIDTYGINYGIAPRINAMGRLESAMDALRLLCARNKLKATRLCALLNETNLERQDLTSQLLQNAIARSAEWADEHIILVEDERYHEGVIGLIAGKLTELFQKPAIAFSVGRLTAKGSARSLSGVHITNLLREFRGEFLLEVGGHPMAAGLKIESGKIEGFRRALYARAKEVISLESLEAVLDVDCALGPDLLTLETATSIQTFAPFGSGNREPLLAFESMQLVTAKLVGKEGKHLKLELQFQTPDSKFQRIEAMAFGKGDLIDTLQIGQTIAVAGHLSINEWRGSRKLQLVVKDIQKNS